MAPRICAVGKERRREDVRQPEGAPHADRDPLLRAAARVVDIHGRQDRLRPRRPRSRGDERGVQDGRAGAATDHDHVVRLGARAQLAHDRLHDRVRGDRPREALEDAGEVLHLLPGGRLALGHAAAGEGGGSRDAGHRHGDRKREREGRQDDPGENEHGEGGQCPGDEGPGESGADGERVGRLVCGRRASGRRVGRRRVDGLPAGRRPGGARRVVHGQRTAWARGHARPASSAPPPSPQLSPAPRRGTTLATPSAPRAGPSLAASEDSSPVEPGPSRPGAPGAGNPCEVRPVR